MTDLEAFDELSALHRRLDAAEKQVADLLADRAHLLKPVGGGDVKEMCSKLNYAASLSARRHGDDFQRSDHIECDAADLLERLTAQLSSTQGKLEAVRKALGFGEVEKRRDRSGTEVNVSHDAVLDLSGALEDLTNSNGNDEVTRRTIKRVIDRLYKARAALSSSSKPERK